MKNKLITTLLTMSALCCAAFAADDKPELFGANELSVQAVYQAHVQDSVDHWRGLGAGVGISYFANRYVGAAVSVIGDERFNELLDSAQAGLRLRYPIGRVAPYAFADVRRDFLLHDFSYVTGGGLEVRLTDHLGVFGQAGHEFDSRRDRGVLVTAGVSLRF